MTTEQSEGLEADLTVVEPETAPAEAEPTGEPPTDGEQPKPQSKSQNAKQRLKRKLREEQEARERAERERRELEEKLSMLEQKVESVVNPPPPRPNRVDFETEEAYEDALFEWRDNMKKPPAPAKPEPNDEKPSEQPQVDPELAKNWKAQEARMQEKYEDFADVVYTIPDYAMTEAMAQAIAESKQGGEIAYHLGLNLELAEEIANKSLAEQVRAIDELGRKLSDNKTTQAPDPVNPLKESGDPNSKLDDPLLAGAKFE